MKVKHIAKIVWKFVDENAPTILMILAETGLVATVFSAIHDAPIARDKLTEAKLDKAEEIERTDPAYVENEESAEWKNIVPVYDLTKIKLTPWEYITNLAPVYWKTAVGFAVTSTCIFLGPHIAKKRYLLALGLLASREKEMEKYKDKIKELFGEKKADQVETELAKDICKNAPDDELNVFYTGEGIQLFYDTASHSWFRSSREAIDRAINRFNSDLLDEASNNDGTAEMSVSDLIYQYGFQLMDNFEVDRQKFHYNANKGNLLKSDITYAAHPRTQEPCGVIKYNQYPSFSR